MTPKEIKLNKNVWSIVGVSFICIGMSLLHAWNIQEQNHRLLLINSIYEAENRIIKDELSALDKQPTYDQMYEKILVRMGGPQSPGAYRDGWDDALKLYGEKDYAAGYHTAIEQFGYTKTSSMNQWLVPEINSSEIAMPAKLNVTDKYEESLK